MKWSLKIHQFKVNKDVDFNEQYGTLFIKYVKYLACKLVLSGEHEQVCIYIYIYNLRLSFEISLLVLSDSLLPKHVISLVSLQFSFQKWNKSLAIFWKWLSEYKVFCSWICYYTWHLFLFVLYYCLFLKNIL